MYKSEYSLFLYPVDPSVFIPQQQIVTTLSEIELLGKQESQHRYQVGESFLSLFCFMGCSPNIELFPKGDNQAYCYIGIPDTSTETQCIISKKPKVPRCPHCKTDLNHLVRQLKENCNLSINCHACSKATNPAELNWRKTAFFAKNSIIIGNIYEAEAIPDQKLLDALEQSTKVAWRYAYIQTSSK